MMVSGILAILGIGAALALGLLFPSQGAFWNAVLLNPAVVLVAVLIGAATAVGLCFRALFKV